MKTSYTDILLKLEDVLLTDLNPHTIHPKILSIEGEEALKIQLIIFNLDQTSEYNSDNMKIDVNMGCANIVFLNWFVNSVLNFLDHFQTAQERIKEASRLAAEAARLNVVTAYERATRIKLNIKIKAPVILIPVHSKSLEAILIDLGNLNATNTISSVKDGNTTSFAEIDEMKVELTDVKLSKVNLKSCTKEDTFSTFASQFRSKGLIFILTLNFQLIFIF
jgi:vacuolar protein sorting-associated protein 13A/C